MTSGGVDAAMIPATASHRSRTGLATKNTRRAEMRRATIASRSLKSGYVVASSRQISRNLRLPGLVAWRLLDERPFWTPAFDKAVLFGPHCLSCPLSLDSGGKASSLTGRPAGDEIAGDAVVGSDVIVYRHSRPMLRQHPPAVGVNLAKGDRRHPGFLKAEAQTADTAECVEHAQSPLLS